MFRYNPKVTPNQVFSAVLSDLSAEDPALAAIAYEHAEYFLAFAETHLSGQNVGTETETEITERIYETGQGISAKDKQAVDACLAGFAWPQAAPADLIRLFLALEDTESPQDRNQALWAFGDRAYTYGITDKDPLSVTEEDAFAIVRFPLCDALPSGGNQEHRIAYLSWVRARWRRQAAQRARDTQAPSEDSKSRQGASQSPAEPSEGGKAARVAPRYVGRPPGQRKRRGCGCTRGEEHCRIHD